MFRSSRQYTLVELLVVITIISVIASLLLPALQGGLEQARTVSCLTNMKQTGIANQQYSDDFAPWACPAQWRNQSKATGFRVQWGGIQVGLGYAQAPLVLDSNSSKPTTATSIYICPSGMTDATTSASPSYLTDPENLRPYASLLPNMTDTTKPRNMFIGYSLNGLSSTGDYPTWRMAPDNDASNNLHFARTTAMRSPSALVFQADGCLPVNNSGNSLSRRHNAWNSINLNFWDGHAATAGALEVPTTGTAANWTVASLNAISTKIKWQLSQ